MHQAETIMAVQRMQEYIDGHLGEEITLKQLSNAAEYSPWHAARIFRESTGRAPFEYIRSVRLTRAALALRDEGPKIIDVAFDFVFDSHEGFTRAFSKEFGISPARYRKTAPPIQLFLPNKVFDVYRAIQKGERRMSEMSEKKETKAVFVQIIERPARKVLLKRGIKAEDYFQYCEEVGCDIWPLLTSVKEALYEPVGMWLPKHLIKEGTSKYVQGVELPLDYKNGVPEGYELIELPPCKMMVFQGEPYDDEDFMDAIGEVWKHIEKFDPTVYGYKWDPEAAPRFQLVPMGYRGYIEALPVAPVN
ncbi:MAG TPA: AraC family transcriptional regulator [Anaerovoracaceae bacterium]|nr:AraC family transcriptional regulator [Anaerovoracaceae bacterium]